MDPEKFAIQSFLNAFGTFDRSLYLLLAKNPHRELLECLYIIALWLWLERGGFSRLFPNLRRLPPFLIHELADEALACLSALNPDFPYTSDAFEIPITSILLESTTSIEFFSQNRPSAFGEIRDFVNEVCLPSVSDIITVERSTPSSMGCLVERFSDMGMGGRDRSIALGKRPASGDEVAPAAVDRTLFVTFANGCIVSEEEVLRFFEKVTFGSSIESFCVRYVGPYEREFFGQALYARVIFCEGFVIDAVLRGMPRGKFFVNGKPIWLRRFVQWDDRLADCLCPSVDACVCGR